MIFSVFVGVVYLVESKTSSQLKKTSDVDTDFINQLINDFDTTAYKAFYSIDELRPFSILQIEKISDMYVSDKWLSPALIVANLTDEDKNKLEDKIIEFIKRQVPEQKKLIYDRLKLWCMADLHFSFMQSKMEIYQQDLLKVFKNIDSVKKIIIPGIKQDLSSNQTAEFGGEYLYYETINYISKLDYSDQLRYMSDVFKELAETGKY